MAVEDTGGRAAGKGAGEQHNSDDPAPRHRAISFRSVTLGMLGVLFVCALTPINDLLLNNTRLIGNFLPIGLVLFFVVFVLVVNAPLSRFLPRWALGTRELAVALGMTLMSCAVPAASLMRYLPDTLVGTYYAATHNATHRQTLENLDLPDWLFPTTTGETLLERARNPVITDYVSRVGIDGVDRPTLMQRVRVVPWQAWATPALAWFVLMAAMWGAILCLCVIVIRQWAENERLPFPLAGVYLSLIEAPKPGHWLNSLLSSRMFWIGAGSVMFIHITNGLAIYLPENVPAIPIRFDLQEVLSEGIWRHVAGSFKSSTLFFSILGIAYFVQSKMLFTLWGVFVLRQVVMVSLGEAGTELNRNAESDQVFGATFAMAVMIIWVGRRHWSFLIRRMVGLGGAGDPGAAAQPGLAVAGWGLIVCGAVAAGWLYAAGATVVVAVSLVVMMLATMLVMARVVAETGLIFAMIGVWFVRPFMVGIPIDHALTTTQRSLWLATFINSISVVGNRESPMVYGTHALKIHHDAAGGGARRWGGAGFIAVLFFALALGYVASGGSHLIMQYNFGATLDATGDAPLNQSVLVGATHSRLDLAHQYQPPFGLAQDRHNGLLHMGLGAAVIWILTALRLRFDWWPFYPVGFLLWESWPLAAAWFSLFLGWLVKLVLVRFGGASVFQAAKPLFIGLILGEAMAACFWLVANIVMAGMGMEYQMINLLPG